MSVCSPITKMTKKKCLKGGGVILFRGQKVVSALNMAYNLVYISDAIA